MTSADALAAGTGQQTENEGQGLRKPPLCALSPYHEQYSNEASIRLSNGGGSRHGGTDQYVQKNLSMSSAGGSSFDGVSLDLEKAHLQKEDVRDVSLGDEEKGSLGRQSDFYRVRQTSDGASSYSDGSAEDSERLQQEKALNMILYLSGPVAALSFIIFAWTILSLIFTLFTEPFRLCTKRAALLASLLGPALNMQLRCIQAPVPSPTDEGSSYRTFILVLVHLGSPLLSIGVVLTAWVVAIYWLLAAMVGDPVGDDRRDDGKETVLWLRNWWERWLVKGLRQ